MNTAKELATQEQTLSGPSIVEYRNNRQLLLQAMHQEMKPGVDYGITPGTNGKPSLWKPGAEKLVSMFAFAPSFEAECERHDDRHRTYTIKCTLKHRGTETFLGDADAVCSTLETKYVARNRTEENPAGTPNNPADYYNTAMKMGGKRALIAAVLFVTGASDIFTQDIDDDEDHAKGGNGGATGRAGGLPTRPRGTDTPKAAPGLWTGTMGPVTVKTFKNKEGKTEEYYILNLADGRSASTFDSVTAQIAREAKDRIVKISTKTGKKQGFFNVESFEVIDAKPAPAKEEQKSKPELDPDLEPAADDIPF